MSSLSRQLVERSHLRGDLHCHTTYSDGADSLRGMAEAALTMGHEYLAVTDHAETTHVNCLTEATLKIQRDEIAALNAELSGRLTILQGVELDIGVDGSLPDLGGALEGLDLVIASIHSDFDLDGAEMTARVVAALSHPDVKIFGHPTARRQGTRPPVEMDLEVVFRTAAENQVALEINSTPTRLDLSEEHILLAEGYGCTFSIDTDSHAASGLQRIKLGLELAQKGGLGPDRIINCLPLEKLAARLNKH